VRRLVVPLALAACSPAGEEIEPRVEWPTLECDVLVPTHCALPFPSNVFTEDDDTTATGRRIAFAPAMMPTTRYGVATDPAPWLRSDGFSTGLGLVAHLPGATTQGFATPLDIDRSLADDSPTVVLDAETGEKLPHFAELDMSTSQADRRALVVRPVVRLANARRYVVAIRDVRGDDGEPLPASEPFAALRDGTPSDEPSIEDRRGLYADIFARLAEAGVARESLQLAWDFTTASAENDTGNLVHMRDEALALVGPGGPEYTITDVVPDLEPGIALAISGTMRVPSYLDSADPSAHLVYGADGWPEPNPAAPWADYPFYVLVPAAAADAPLPLAQFGHGLFSERFEIEWFEIPFATGYGYVLFAVDWVGMAGDLDKVTIAAYVESGTFERFAGTIDRLHQGVLNQLLAMRMMSGRFVVEPAIQLGGHSAIDPAQRFYYGSSQGGILGGTYLTLSTDVARGMLDTGGMPYNLLLPRSEAFEDFFSIIKGQYEDALDIVVLLGLAQMLWDRVEPNGFVAHLRGDAAEAPLPGTPPHEVLIRPAVGDHQVTTLGAHVMARTVGARHLDTGIRDVWGLVREPGPIVGSALVEYDFGLPEPLENVPPDSCGDPHDVLREVPAGQMQLDRFFRTGEIAGFCAGACSFPELIVCE
jgi:hypothetical protein